MKSLILILSIILFNALIISPVHTSSRKLALEINGSNDIVEQTCKKLSQYYDLCMASLKSDPRSATADLYGLANITLDHIMSNATTTLKYVKELAAKTEEVYMRRYLDTCVQIYEKTVDDWISEAMKSLKSKDYKEVNYVATWCSNGAESCEEEFGGSPVPRKSPLTEQNALVHDLCGLASEIAYLLSSALVRPMNN